MINGMFNTLSGMLASAQKLQNSANNLISLQGLSIGKNNIVVGDKYESGLDLGPIKAIKVDISKQMVNQVIAKASFSANSKLVVVADKNIGTILNIKS